MRKLIVGAMISLDGVMQAPGGSEEDPTGGFKFGGWVMPYFDEVFAEEIERLFTDFDLLLGRKTYEIFAAYWPYYEEEARDNVIATKFNSVKKYVVSRSGEVDTAWRGSVLLRSVDEVKKLKEEDGPPLVTQGSTQLIHALMARDLVDELCLFTVPVVLGGGKKLFDDMATPHSYKLTRSRVSAKGFLAAHYEVEGRVKPSDFPLNDPTDRELARRIRMNREG